MKFVDYTPYEEDIYVGYRYFDSFGKDISYPFGYGLSYTTFEYGTPVMAVVDGKYVVKVEVKNTGKTDGKEVVQLYVTAPDAKAANKPEKELKAFAKTRELAPGESETVVLTVDPATLASFDEAESAWVVAPGTYRFLVGASSRDIRGEMTADVEGSQQKVASLLSPKTEINRLTRN